MGTSQSLGVVRHAEKILSDDRRVIPRYLPLGRPGRIRSVVERVLAIPESRVPAALREIERRFSSRHRDIHASFRENGERALRHVRGLDGFSEARRLLIGAHFTMEYSIEAAALFNPSIVPHPDQGDLPAGAVRFLMSLRATGEGHVSSIVFRRGVIDGRGRIAFDPPPRYAWSAAPHPERRLEKSWFARKLRDGGFDGGLTERLIAELVDPFAPSDLRHVLAGLRRKARAESGTKRLAAYARWVAQANYEVHFPEDCRPSEIVVFPATEYESSGMEDVRLVRFEDDDARVTYYGTYTAYDGRRIQPMLIETTDFHAFHIRTLAGRYARNKGMALFPRKVDGHYLMLSRHDGENLFLLHSRDLYVWNASQHLAGPREPWELVQIGNCGSPLETEAGWLVLTHGVGPVRQYSIGALLLDRARPERVLGRLRSPLLVPAAEDPGGYVPNVVYSCGSMVHRGRLVVPYGIADSRTALATVRVDRLIGRLLDCGP